MVASSQKTLIKVNPLRTREEIQEMKLAEQRGNKARLNDSI